MGVDFIPYEILGAGNSHFAYQGF
ncbi:hypothetical protein [Geopsychrobacter electrodiphilus]